MIRRNAIIKHPFIVGLSIRFILMVALPLLLDDGLLLQGVKYTDIDYLVFTDAARHVANGRSPFERHTYRYTPFLAWILSWADYSKLKSIDTSNRNIVYRLLRLWRQPRFFGRMMFCLADALCGLVILSLRRHSRQKKLLHSDGNKNHSNVGKDQTSFMNKWMPSVELQDALWWLYNPLPINIATRGSAESFVVLLPVLAAVVIAIPFKSTQTRSSVLCRSAIAGTLHGLAVHAKLYPIIYTASFMTYFSFMESIAKNQSIGRDSSWDEVMTPSKKHEKDISKSMEFKSSQYPFPWFEPKRLCTLIFFWIRRLFGGTLLSPIIFLSSFAMTFVTLTYLAVKFYGSVSLEEGLLYHFSRVDHRHNYSMFWYWIYLARSRVTRSAILSSLSTMGRALLLPQMVLLIYSSLGIAPYDLPYSLFVQTFLFVCQNKVITAQYFTWYLCLLPLCSDRINWNCKWMMRALMFLGLSILHWLGWAFCLEMKGLGVHVGVWFASCLFFLANVNLLGVILRNYCGIQWDTSSKMKIT